MRVIWYLCGATWLIHGLQYCKLGNRLKSLSPLWDFGTNCRQPFSRVQSSNGIHNPKALGGSVYRKVESRWGVTVKEKYKRKRLMWLASCEMSSSCSLVLPPSYHRLGRKFILECNISLEYVQIQSIKVSILQASDNAARYTHISSVYFGFCGMKAVVRSKNLDHEIKTCLKCYI